MISEFSSLQSSDPIRTLFITRSVPYPPIGGSPLRNWQNMSIMMKFGCVGVFSVLAHEPIPDNTSFPGIAMSSVHNIGDDRKSIWEKIKYKLRHKLLCLWDRKYAYASKYYTPSNAQNLDRVLAKFQPQIVVFEELCLYSYLEVVKRYSCHVIFDDHNAETSLYREIYKAKLLEAPGIKAKIKMGLKLASIAFTEQNFARQANQVWVCSEGDANLLETLCHKALPIHVVPNGVDTTYYDSVRLGYHNLPSELEPSPLTLIFTATFNYQPNKLAANLLLEQIYPELRKIYPTCRLLLVGVSPTQNMQKAAKKDRQIVVTGKVPDIRPYLSASSVVIVPLFHGGGTRLKILEAFATGRPVVTTSKGAEGLKVKDGEHLLINDTTDTLVAGVSKLWSDPSLRQKITHNAYELVRTQYSWETVGKKVETAIGKLF
jgi:polysaccharide biosynthesis protein PslH